MRADGELEKFRPIAEKMNEVSTEEGACFSNGYYHSLSDQNRLRIHKEQEDEAALAHHFISPRVAEFQKLFMNSRLSKWM